MKKLFLLLPVLLLLVACNPDHQKLVDPELKNIKYIGIAHKSGCNSNSCWDTVTFEHKGSSYNFNMRSPQADLLVVGSTYDIKYSAKGKDILNFDVASPVHPELEKK